MPVQGTDMPKECGYLAYTGQCTDPNHTKNTLLEELQLAYPNKKWMIGATVKRRKDLGKPSRREFNGYNSDNFILAENQVVVIEAEARQAKLVSKYCKARYNSGGNAPPPAQDSHGLDLYLNVHS